MSRFSICAPISTLFLFTVLAGCGEAGKATITPAQDQQQADAKPDPDAPVKATPLDPLDKGRARARSGKYKEAIAELDRLAAADPSRPDTLVARGEVHDRARDKDAAQRDFAEAIRLAEALLEQKANDPAALLARGMARRFQKDYGAALADLDAALQAQPNDAVALRERGVVLRNLGRLKEAIASYDKSLAVAPDDPVALNARGFARFSAGDPAGAIADYRAALAREPDYVKALANRGDALVVLGETEEAIKDFTRLVALVDDAPGRAILGRSKLLAGDAKGAVLELDKALRLEPREGGLYFLRAIACFHAGQFEACMVDAELLQAAFRENFAFLKLHSAARWAKVGFHEPTDAEIAAARAKVSNTQALELFRANMFAERAALLPEGSSVRDALATRRISEIGGEIEARASAQAELNILESLRAEMQARKKAAAEFSGDTEMGRAAKRLILAGAKLKLDGGAKREVIAADLSFCCLRDEEVALLRHFPSLRSIALAETWTTDAGLRPLAGLRELREIDLRQTQASDAATFWLGKLPQLERANLSKTSISDAGLAMLLRSPGLKHLDLDGATLSPAGLEQLYGKKGWRSLSLEKLPVEDAAVKDLCANSPDLESLNLSGTKITDAAMTALGKLTKLRNLRLADTVLSDAGLGELRPNKRWEWLDLSNTQVSDDGIASLSDVKDLRVFHLFGTDVTIGGLRKLSGLQNLASLTVPSNVLMFHRDELRQLFPKAYSYP